MSEAVRVHAATHDYDVRVGPGLLRDAGRLMLHAGLRGKVAVVSDENVLRHWRAPLEQVLSEAGLAFVVLSTPAGEEHKTLAAAEPLYGRLVEAGLQRSDTLVALGGGVVGDLTGFLAATYHRGMSWVQVPTTLLAQVDSSVGGKVAVDHPLGKNLIGAFHPPRLVVADTETLSTLPARERWGGLAEMVKAGLIADEAFVSQLEQNLESLANSSASPEALRDAVRRAVEIKAHVVSVDEKEQGLRLHLNFGHTLGHALETATGYKALTHGEAVVIGMRAAVQVSVDLGKLTADDATRALRLLARFPRPPALTARPSAESILAAFTRDKKATRAGVRFIVLEAIGRAAVVPALPAPTLDVGVRTVLEQL